MKTINYLEYLRKELGVLRTLLQGLQTVTVQGKEIPDFRGNCWVVERLILDASIYAYGNQGVLIGMLSLWFE